MSVESLTIGIGSADLPLCSLDSRLNFGHSALVAGRSLSADLEAARAVFVLPDWEAARACTGLARDFFVLRHINRAMARARGAGNDLVGWNAQVDGDALALEMLIPKRFKMERTLRVTQPVLTGDALTDFTLAGVPLAEVINPLGVSVDAQAVGWAMKMPVAGAQLKLWFIDAALACALPREMPRRPALIPMPSDSGAVITNEGSRFTMTEVSSTRRIGRTGFICEMYPKLPRPRIGPNDPGEPRTAGPDPSAVAIVEVGRGDPPSEWFRFELTEPIERRSGVVQLEPMQAMTSGDRLRSQLLNDPLAGAATGPVKTACKPHGLTGSAELAERVTAAVLLLREIQERDAEALNATNRRSTSKSVAELVAAMDEEALGDLLRRAEING